jgi:methyl-accepting chemotaxis protein
VKNLANQTARATDEISAQITSVQQKTGNAVAAIQDIANTISQMDEVSSMIAAAVEQQGAATQDISRNIQQAFEGTMEVARNIAGVRDGADESSNSANEVASLATELNREAEAVRALVDSFLIGIRSEGATLEWGEAWLTGNATIDADHKMLVQYVNELNAAMLEGKGHDIAANILTKLAQYTHDHFNREEGIWQNGGLKSLSEHKATHAALLTKVNQLLAEFKQGKASLTNELMSFLREWLINHVFKIDKAGVREITGQHTLH